MKNGTSIVCTVNLNYALDIFFLLNLIEHCFCTLLKEQVITVDLFLIIHCKNADGNKFHIIQAQFSQMRPVPMTPSMTPRLPMYPPMPTLGQQLFYGQAPPAMMPPQVLVVSCVSFILNFALHSGFPDVKQEKQHFPIC